MAETSPPPATGAESCSEEPARGGKQRQEERRRAPAGGADREDKAGPPLASPPGPSEPGSPVAAPFFLLYPGDGGAGFVARPPPQQQQRAWRTNEPLCSRRRLEPQIPWMLFLCPSGSSLLCRHVKPAELWSASAFIWHWTTCGEGASTELPWTPQRSPFTSRPHRLPQSGTL